MEAAEQHTKDYEIGFIGRDEKAPHVVLEMLKKHEAEILLEGQLERIVLAYPIKKETAAFFGYAHFRVPAQSIALIDRALKSEPAILRFLIVTPPFVKPKPRWEQKPRVKSEEPTLPIAEHRAEPLPLSNEALEKKIEEILQ